MINYEQAIWSASPRFGCFSLYDNLGNTKHCKMKLFLKFIGERKRAPRKNIVILLW